MGSLPEEEEEEYASDLQSDRCGSYSPSADVSESESSGDLSDRAPLAAAAASAPFASSPLAALLPADPHLVLWEPKLEKRDTDFSGLYCLCPRLQPFRSLDRYRLATRPIVSEVEMMKERFAKLLLGEDMSGGGKGVCTALAISNAITNLSGEIHLLPFCSFVRFFC